jgi:RimJ/RimL family protein N-acetyltransferase
MLGICVLPPWQGIGVADDALTLLVSHAHDALLLHKVSLEVLTSNVRAIRFYKRHKFQEVGIRRLQFPWAGEWLDVTVMERILGS